ncbi:SPL family radical SAM protein [Candidatus Xianfuyuplasma coldseepsis]|uniref:Radical SAM protein n=1 Tax=Candidatus Xianfuyuplasma coldseepsis TaxID=2782163 RepID=A0A7L7KQI1_9MOLU|nr:radical SAM protein [Xianfuyuplasma coldseepsis]QMS84486.1 radical SAM protein [Xianfuyuplasma coldseepsis]
MEEVHAIHLIHPVQSGQSWFGVTHNTNIYRGCNHGCIYCDSRSSCYQIDNFDTIRVKKEASVKIDQELSTKRKKGVLGFGGMNDPYNSFEKSQEETRKALQSVNKYGFGAHIITKSDLVVRDIDIFQAIQCHSIMNIGITITTADDRLQKRIERSVSTTSDRFKAIKTLIDAGLYAGILMMPILPFINDNWDNIKGIIDQAKEAGAKYIYPSFGVTLRDNQRQYFFQKIGPDLTKQYVDTFKDQYMCISPNAEALKRKFKSYCDECGIIYSMKDIIKGAQNHITTTQLSLF